MASDRQADFIANLTREKYMLEQVLRVTGLPDREAVRAEARSLEGDSASAKISRLQDEIAALREHPITRWVDADPEWRDASGKRVNRH